MYVYVCIYICVCVCVCVSLFVMRTNTSETNSSNMLYFVQYQLVDWTAGNSYVVLALGATQRWTCDKRADVNLSSNFIVAWATM